MEDASVYEARLRDKITRLRLEKNVSEHRMSLELGKSGAYIRSITSGASLPSVRELFNIIQYFGLTPADFFRDFEDGDSLRAGIHQRLLRLDEADLEKVSLFLSWITSE